MNYLPASAYIYQGKDGWSTTIWSRKCPLGEKECALSYEGTCRHFITLVIEDDEATIQCACENGEEA